MRVIFLVSLLLFQFLAFAQPAGKPRIYYVGNMGIAIVKNDSVVLIDALHDYYGVYYLPSDTAILSKLQKRQAPFRHLLAVTATHVHGDHFDSTLFKKISETLPQVKIIAGNQFAPFLKEIKSSLRYFAEEEQTFTITQDLKITIKRISHVGGDRHGGIKNYRVEVIWDKFRLIHFGDAEISASTFSGIGPGADVAIIPNWFCTDKKALGYLLTVGFKTCIVTHIQPSGSVKLPEEKLLRFIVFREYGDAWFGQ